jgi:hypothetical protein
MNLLNRKSRSLVVLIALAGSAGTANAQPTLRDLDTRLQAVEARLQALESGAQDRAIPAVAGIPCKRLNVNGSVESDIELRAMVNGAVVGTFGTGGVYHDLESFMRPGPNRISLVFSAPGPMSNAELRCLPPDQSSSRTTILTLRPTARKLSAEADVSLPPR